MSDDGWWVADLLFVIVLTGLAGGGILLGVPGPVRVVLALALVLVLPGYALVAAFFPASNRGTDDLGRFDDDPGGLVNPLPKDYEIGGIERAILSVTLSIAVVPAVAAVASFTSWGVKLLPILGGVCVLTVCFVAVAAIRRLRLPRTRRYRPALGRLLAIPTPFDTGSPLARSSRRRRTANLAAIVAALLVLSSVGYALTFPPAQARFTEFYVERAEADGGTIADYPSSFVVGHSRTVTVAIENHEGGPITYSVVTVLRDEGTDSGEPFADVLATDRVTVEDGNVQRLPVSVTPTRSGPDLRLQFLLFRGDPPTSPTAEAAYRVLDLNVTIDGPGFVADRPAAVGSTDVTADLEASSG